MSKQKVQLLASLEIGSTKVGLAVAKASGEKLEVISVAQAPHKGMHQGQIVDSREILSAIQKVKAETEATINGPVPEVLMAVSDISIETVFTKGVVAVRRMVSRKDLDEALQAAVEGAQIRSDREILHSYAHTYKINGVKTNEAPIKQKATSLELTAVLVTGLKKNQQIARECLASAGLVVADVVAHPIATAYGLLQKEDKDAGVAVVDIGGSLTDIIAYKDGKLMLATSLSVGGATFTQDLAVGLRTPQLAAEKIKRNHGAALVDVVSPGEMVEVESLKGEPARQVEARFICEILEARSEETLGLILKKLNDEDLLFKLKNGVVLTGGGSQLPGLPELGEFTFDVKLRRGVALDVVSANPLAQGPVMTTSIGLLQYARNRQSFETSELSVDTFKNSWGRFKNFIENIL